MTDPQPLDQKTVRTVIVTLGVTVVLLVLIICVTIMIVKGALVA